MNIVRLLSTREGAQTEKNCRCKVIILPKADYAPHVSDNTCYSWKPIIVKAASQHAKKVIVWQDSSVRWFRESFLASLDRAYEAGHQVLRHFKSHRIPANTLKETFDYIHDDACGYLPYPEIQGNVHIHRADDFNRRVVFEPWTRCALEKQCMCPRPPSTVIGCGSGTLHRCHRLVPR
ncbi:metk_1 protein [Plakobranchus ocellatus]|uniref:Metk_1 protein n=1 Tax=Plakobranchus ocellatus TaxID=259542 RepID=A0AAV4BRU0_9GAST|nr:metk_1 protein [Plakobranchus ocellatus]